MKIPPKFVNIYWGFLEIMNKIDGEREWTFAQISKSKQNTLKRVCIGVDIIMNMPHHYQWAT